jgi:hypothetical protein
MGGSFIIVVSLCGTDFTMVYVMAWPARKIGGVHAGGRCHHESVIESGLSNSELIRLVVFGLPVCRIYGVWACSLHTVARM